MQCVYVLISIKLPHDFLRESVRQEVHDDCGAVTYP